jgi:UDP-N-acetylmuramate dehydrogenase
MKSLKIYQKLRQSFEGEIHVDEYLSKHTSFRIGGPADFYLYPKALDNLRSIVLLCEKEKITRFIIGNGTNLLVSDNGFHGVVIDLSKTFNYIKCEGKTVTVGAGVNFNDLIKYCTKRGLSGLETLVGIPGQVGGEIFLNAGAFGVEIFDHLLNIRLLDRDGVLERINKDRIKVGYRYTNLPKDGIIVEAQFLLREGNPKEMEAVQQNYLKKRREKQPLSLPSAGSVFKSPPGDFAGRIIEEVGCKGLRIGDAMVSKKHANFIVNCHLARAQDVIRLIQEVKERVLKKFGIHLELEIHLLGFNNSGEP